MSAEPSGSRPALDQQVFSAPIVPEPGVSADASSSTGSVTSSDPGGTESSVPEGYETPVDTAPMLRDIVERTNLVRAAYAVSPVQDDPDLALAAQAWADTMLESGTYQHSSDDRLVQVMNSGGFGALGENLHAPERQCQAAPTCEHPFANPTSGTLLVDWFRSPSHHGNMLDARWDRIGVGVACAPDGRVWAAVLYASSTPTNSEPVGPSTLPVEEPVLVDNGYTCSGEFRDTNPKWQHPTVFP